MPYTNSNHKIDLNDYTKIKELTNGRTNQVALWQHKKDKQIKIVVKEPNGINPDLLHHNIRAINAFCNQSAIIVFSSLNVGRYR